MPSKSEVLNAIKSGELITPEYQESCRQRKVEILLERSKREKRDDDFYTKLLESNKANRESEISEAQMDTWGTQIFYHSNKRRIKRLSCYGIIELSNSAYVSRNTILWSIVDVFLIAA